MQRKKRELSMILGTLIVLAAMLIAYSTNAAVKFRPLPYEDSVNGRNTNAYNSAIGHPTWSEKIDFINSVKQPAIVAGKAYGIPVSVIMGMSIVESGYGFSRSAYFANNLFGLKIWKQNPSNAWQLKGQPDEAGGAVPVSVDYGQNRKIYNEAVRKDNWYYAFKTRNDAIYYLAKTVLSNRRYRPAKDSYREHIAAGWSLRDAARQYCYDIAQSGYNHSGGSYYRRIIGETMDQYNLYQYDAAGKGDSQEPWVSSISVSPVGDEGYFVWGNVTISIAAGDNAAVSKVEFYSNNGKYLINSDTQAPYSIRWVTKGNVVNGPQTLRVIVYDQSGNKTGTSRSIYVANK